MELLPRDILISILDYLPLIDHLNVVKVCKNFQDAYHPLVLPILYELRKCILRRHADTLSAFVIASNHLELSPSYNALTLSNYSYVTLPPCYSNNLSSLYDSNFNSSYSGDLSFFTPTIDTPSMIRLLFTGLVAAISIALSVPNTKRYVKIFDLV
jgi:hypothetical protein